MMSYLLTLRVSTEHDSEELNETLINISAVTVPAKKMLATILRAAAEEIEEAQ